MRNKDHKPVTRVADCRKWQEMAGNTPLEQMINSYLTSRFILRHDIPADECLPEARRIIDIIYAYGDGDSGAAWDVLGRKEFP